MLTNSPTFNRTYKSPICMLRLQAVLEQTRLILLLAPSFANKAAWWQSVTKSVQSCSITSDHSSQAGLKRHKSKLMRCRGGLQAPAKHQQTIAHVLGIPHHKVVCHVKRIGGGFGGKESRSVFPNAAAAVPAYILRRPVRLVLDRDEDMHMTGHRHAFLGKYKVLHLTIAHHSSHHPLTAAPQSTAEQCFSISLHEQSSVMSSFLSQLHFQARQNDLSAFRLMSSHQSCHHSSYSCTSEHSSTLCPAVLVASLWAFIISAMCMQHAASFRLGLPSGGIQQGRQGASLGLQAVQQRRQQLGLERSHHGTSCDAH